MENKKQDNGNMCCDNSHEILHRNTTDRKHKKIVIVGGGIAALSAAATIRSLDHLCHIDLYTEEFDLPYWRNRLSKALYDPEALSFYIHDEAWYQSRQIYIHRNEKIQQLSYETQTIVTQDNKRIPYDELILAMGAHAILPEISGNDLENVFTLHSLLDAKILARAVKKSHRCVIVGGGILGMEVACMLSDAHLEVTLIEMLPAIMAKVMNPSGSELLKRYLESQKIHVLLHAQIKRIHGNKRVESVELENGKCINADFVLFATGIKANLELIRNTPLEYEQFLHVDSQMRTNLPHIYACGDVASMYGTHIASCSIAQKQGEIAAKTICGQIEHFLWEPQTICFRHDAFHCFLIGNIRQLDQSVEYWDEAHHRYEKYGFQEEHCCGALLINKENQVPSARFAVLNQYAYPLLKTENRESSDT